MLLTMMWVTSVFGDLKTDDSQFHLQGVICRENLQKINIIIFYCLVQFYQIMQAIVPN